MRVKWDIKTGILIVIVGTKDYYCCHNTFEGQAEHCLPLHPFQWAVDDQLMIY